VADLIAALAEVVQERLPGDGLGKLYSSAELLGDLPTGQVAKQDLDDAVGTGRVTVHYRGGWTGVPVTLDRPNRSSTLHAFGSDLFGLDTEAAVQAGALLWLNAQGLVARGEVPDDETVWSRLADSRDLSNLGWDSRRAGIACRDIVSHWPGKANTSIEIWEVKGKTAVEGDFYETFGQVFPIADPSVTRGWTSNKVPKHGRALRWAEYLSERWAAEGREVSLAVGVLVPDLPPPAKTDDRFYDGPGRYYGTQASVFSSFAESGECEGNHVFPRLLRHLCDRHDLNERVHHKASISFRFLGFQSIGFIRDFATGAPLVLRRKAS